MRLRVLMTRHSAFYSPIACAVAAGFLEREGFEASFGQLGPGDRASLALREGRAEVAQNAPSATWQEAERGAIGLPLHFALINQFDGFFLAGRKPDPEFDWKKLEGAELVADHFTQPFTMLRYACDQHGVDWSKIRLIDAGTPEQMEAAFREGRGDYTHLQAPGPERLEQAGVGVPIVSVGAGLKPLAFSTLCAMPEFLAGPASGPFLRAYLKAREWVRSAPPAEVAASEAGLFPGTGLEALTAAVARYQQLGCWNGDHAIGRERYAQALDIFQWAEIVKTRFPFEKVCAS